MIILRMGPSILLYIIIGYLVVDPEDKAIERGFIKEESPRINPPPILVHRFLCFCLYLFFSLSAAEADVWQSTDP